GQPCVKVLQRRIEATGNGGIARPAENLLKIALELKHVAHIFGARKPELPIRIRRYVVVAHLLPQRRRQRGRHLGPRYMLAGDTDGLPNELSALLENGQSALADILDGDAGELLIAHRI